MGTVAAVESRDGVVIAGDTRVVNDGTVTSETVQRVFDFDTVGVGVVGNTGDIQEFRRHLEDEVQAVRTEQKEKVEIDKLAQIASRHAEKTNVTAVVATADSDGVVRLREVGPNGQIFETQTTALGSGAEMAISRLDTMDRDRSLEDVISKVSEIVENAGERDTATGEDLDICSLPNETNN